MLLAALFGPSLADLLALLAPLAHAQGGIVSETAATVSSGLTSFFGSGCSGADCAISMVEYVIERVQTLVTVVGVFVICRNGITMIYSGVEEEQNKARKAIGTCLAGVMLTYMAPKFVEAFYTAGGEEGVFASAGAAQAGASVMSEELFGVLRWALVTFASACMLVMIISGVKALTSFGSEEGTTALKRAVISIVIAVLLLTSAEAIKATFGVQDFGQLGAPSPYPIIARGVQIINGVLGALGALALAIVIYAALMMILSAGNEEQFQSMKKLIIRSGIGLIVVLISYLVARFIFELLA